MTAPRLSRVLDHSAASPERVVQFGTGAFLRGFADAFIHDANERGHFHGSVVAVSSTGSTRDAVLNAQGGLYTLAFRGIEGGTVVRRNQLVRSISRALSARDDWDAVLSVARRSDLSLVISNTTEVGIALDPDDRFDHAPPRSFPGKLTRFLFERGRAFGWDPACGITVLPCELIERNGDTLAAIVRELAKRWSLGEDCARWLATSVRFHNTLVDRIVPGAVSTEEAVRLATELGYRDEMITTCEPYALFAIEGDEALRERLGFAVGEPRVIIAPDIQPYRERKVRLLNGTHTLLAPVGLLAGFSIVRDACADERVGRFMRRAMFDEILPVVDAPGASEFAHDVVERFLNPFIDHALIDITLHGTAKLRVRVVPSIVALEERTGRVAASLAFGFAAHLAFLRGEVHDARRVAGLSVPADAEGERIRSAWSQVDVENDEAVGGLARTVCADASLWGSDLTAFVSFVDAVSDHLVRIVRHGIHAALDAHLTETAALT